MGRTYERENCSAARALEITGERWSLDRFVAEGIMRTQSLTDKGLDLHRAHRADPMG